MTITKPQIKAINTMLYRKGLMADKKELISSFTNGRTERVSELDQTDARELIELLNKDFVPDVEGLRLEKMRRKCIAIGHSTGLIERKSVVTQKGISSSTDYSRFEAWLLKFGYLHKKLNEYSYSEITKLISQLEKVENTAINR